MGNLPRNVYGAYCSMHANYSSWVCFSIGAYQDKTDQPGHTVMLSVLVSLMYAMTSYQIYLSGFEVCAGIALAHAMIMFLTHIFKLIIPKRLTFIQS